uniref:Probable serine/threonine-protein kinase vps15 isoform X2 n=1 Tax=Dermatophagoides pteronyssinus TaxID=6956 RepID=A0A6P6YM57_DERPT|nr:probable serine/threonine-protein kinase vps15 isoform X2 [Dermatophagoides pteronyssinus]
MARSRALSLSSMFNGVLDQHDGHNGNHDMITIESNSIGIRNAQHLTIAGGFLDFALFVADVEHLKFLLDTGSEHVKYYVLLIIMLCASLILQNNKPKTTYQRSFKANNNNNNNKNNDNKMETLNSNEQQPQQQQSATTSISVPFETNQKISVDDKDKVEIINHITICIVTLIAILNVFITVFGDRNSITIEKMNHFKNDNYTVNFKKI